MSEEDKRRHILEGRMMPAGYIGEPVVLVRPGLNLKLGVIIARANQMYTVTVRDPTTGDETIRKVNGRRRLRVTLQSNLSARSPPPT